MTSSRPGHFYKVHPLTCRPDDFWGQVKRTVDGKPVDQSQIDMLVGAIVAGLDLRPADVVLDIGCGNGALSDLIFARCAGGVGIDFSEVLIDVAQRNFQQAPTRRYLLADATAFVKSDDDTGRFTKILCCSSIQYFDDALAVALLRDIKSRYSAARRIYLGNIPDRDLIDSFAPPASRAPGIESDPDTAIGIWRTPAELSAIASAAGWTATIVRMPRAYFAARYRFDAVLARAG